MLRNYDDKTIYQSKKLQSKILDVLGVDVQQVEMTLEEDITPSDTFQDTYIVRSSGDADTGHKSKYQSNTTLKQHEQTFSEQFVGNVRNDLYHPNAVPMLTPSFALHLDDSCHKHEEDYVNSSKLFDSIRKLLKLMKF